MAKTFDAPFAQSKKTAFAVLTAAKTTYNDAANAVLLYTASAEGDLVRRVSAVPRATITARQIMLFRSIDAGATLQFFDTALMPAYTMDATTQPPRADFDIDFDRPLSLAPNERLYAAMGVALAGGVVVTVEGEAFA